MTPSRLTEYLFDPAGASDQPVLLFQHLQKTGGSSLRDVIRANLGPMDCDARRYDHFRTSKDLSETFRDYHSSLSPEPRPETERPSLLDLPDETLEEIRAYNWLDLELYEFCGETLDRELAQIHSASPHSRDRPDPEPTTI